MTDLFSFFSPGLKLISGQSAQSVGDRVHDGSDICDS